MLTSEFTGYVPMPGYEPRYLISEVGQVLTLSKCCKGELLKQRIDARSGYWTVKLHRDGKDSTQFVHKLLALAFIPNPDGKSCINHINGDKLDNRLTNLEWVTHSENMKHAYRIGLINCCACGKKVMDHCTGTMYPTIKAAANASGINYPTLKNYLNGNRTNHTCLQLVA
jgi:hypothetical protein